MPSLSRPPRLLLIKMSALGDVVRAIPLLVSLKESLPEVEIGWAVDRRFEGLIADHPYLDWVHPLPREYSRWPGCPELHRIRELGYDTAIDAQGRFKTALLGLLAGCKQRVGMAHRRSVLRWSYTDTVALKALRTVDRMAEMGAAVGADPSVARNYLPISGAMAADASRLLAPLELADGEPLAALVPGTSVPQKCWPVSSYAQLARQLHQTGVKSVIVGAPSEREMARELASGADCGALALAGETNIPQLAAVLARCDLTVAGDTGPAHVSAALGTPVVALFGPTDSAEHRPWGEGHLVLDASMPCRPCGRHPRCREYDCMRAIAVEDVLAACNQVLESAGARAAQGNDA